MEAWCMKKKGIIAFIGILLVLGFCVAGLCFRSVSYCERKVSVKDIAPDETILAMRYQNDSWSHQDALLLVDKNRRCKVVDISEEKTSDKDLLYDMDLYLKDKQIKYMKEPFDISQGMIGKIINIEGYRLPRGNAAGADQGVYSFYSVCGSGKERKLVLMSRQGDYTVRNGNKRINSLCEKMKERYQNRE